MADFAIPNEVSEYAQSVFVEMRKYEHDMSQGQEIKTTADTFHQWLTLSRLLAVSEGSLELSKEQFDRARDLERQRLVRAPVQPV